MSGIFISYRRADSSGYAGGLYKSLSKRFGKRHVFMDIDTLQPGLDFGRALDQAVSTCDVVIALVGPGWIDAQDSEGRRRLDNPEDLVRIEIATALAREDTRVIPVLVGNAPMPRAETLPEDLKSLARRHNIELSDERWDYDVNRLLARLEPMVKSRRRPWIMPAAITALLAVIAIAIYTVISSGLRPEEPSTIPSTDIPTEVVAPTSALPLDLQMDVAGASDDRRPSIQVTKKHCPARDFLPVFVESNCSDVSQASFRLTEPAGNHAGLLKSGQLYIPDSVYFGQSDHWNLEDASTNRSNQGVRLVTCVGSQPGSEWDSSVPVINQTGDHGSVSIGWGVVASGTATETYRPSLECIWFELPLINVIPASLSLQVFTSGEPYLEWTQEAGPQLPIASRGESGDDLEARMVMTGTTHEADYSFWADSYGQVLVPPGGYLLTEQLSGVSQVFSMENGDTILVEVGVIENPPRVATPTLP